MIRKIGYLDDKKQFNVIKDITEREEREIYDFERELGDYFNDILLYQMVLKNYQIIVDLIEAYEVEVNNDRRLQSFKETVIELNRCILNFLTVFRTFLDHHEARIKREYGKESQELRQFKKYCSSEFDSNVAYRFFYKYRNYCQHCGVPISRIVTRLTQTDTGEEKAVFDIFISKEGLLKDFNWGPIVKGDIEAHEGDLNLKKLLLEFDGSIKDIHKGIIRIKKDRILSAFKMLMSYTYRPEVGLISVGIITARNLEEYKKGNAQINPIDFSNFKEIIDDLRELGFDSLEIDGQSFLLKTLC